MVLSALLIVPIVLCMLPGTALVAPAVDAGTLTSHPGPFTDTEGLRWAVPAVSLLAAEGIVKGVSRTRFEPNSPLTEEQAVVLLSRLRLPPRPPQKPAAKGVGPAPPLAGGVASAEDAVRWAEESRIVRHPESFRPTRFMTRAQATAWTVRAFRLAGPPAAASFRDSSAIPAAYSAAVGLAQRQGVVKGNGRGDFSPLAPMTRAQMAVVLVRAEMALALQRPDYVRPFTWALQMGQNAPSEVMAGTFRSGSISPFGPRELELGAADIRSADGVYVQRYAAAGNASFGVGAGSQLLTPAGGVAQHSTFYWTYTPYQQIADSTIALWRYPLTSGLASTLNPTVAVGADTVHVPWLLAPLSWRSQGGIDTVIRTCLSNCASNPTWLTYRGPVFIDEAAIIEMVRAVTRMIGGAAGS